MASIGPGKGKSSFEWRLHWWGRFLSCGHIHIRFAGETVQTTSLWCMSPYSNWDIPSSSLSPPPRLIETRCTFLCHSQGLENPEGFLFPCPAARMRWRKWKGEEKTQWLTSQTFCGISTNCLLQSSTIFPFQVQIYWHVSFCCLLTSFILSSQIDQRNVEHFYPRNSHESASLVSIPNTQPVTQSSTDNPLCLPQPRGPTLGICHSVPCLTFRPLHSWPTWTQANVDTSLSLFLPFLYINVCFLTVLLAFNPLWK